MYEKDGTISLIEHLEWFDVSNLLEGQKNLTRK